MVIECPAGDPVTVTGSFDGSLITATFSLESGRTLARNALVLDGLAGSRGSLARTGSRFRIGGGLGHAIGQVRLDMAPLMPANTKELVEAIYRLSGRDVAIFLDGHNHDDDFSFAVAGMGRFRVNVFRQRGSLGAVIRVIRMALRSASA